MPRSKKRKGHQYHAPANAVKSKKNRSAVITAIIFFAVIGIGIAFFAQGVKPLWLMAGAIAGSIAGYYFGKQLDKSFAKKQL